MNKSIFSKLLVVCLSLSAVSAHAVTGVNPSGVNVRSSGTTTVFLTFQGMRAGQTLAEAFWCGEVTATGVSNSNPCLPGTIFGQLPLRFDRSTRSGTKGASNLTDVMTIPASVSRRAFQQAANGGTANFFYVRRFTGDGPDEFVTVTCRMAGGGARSPLALTEVRLYFDTAEGDRPVYTLERDRTPPPLYADIRYNGSGRFKGRWEVVLPGDPEPTAADLLTEATLPIERRGLQRRYTQVGRFDVFLPPTGRIKLEGPDVARLPNRADGPYKVLLRVEATEDKEGSSNTIAGVVASGGVAGFPMPVLRYYVGSAEGRQVSTASAVRLNTASTVGGLTTFSWIDVTGASLYSLEVASSDGAVLSAVVDGTRASYTAPPWLQEKAAGKELRWRVTAMDRRGNAIARSDWSGLPQ